MLNNETRPPAPIEDDYSEESLGAPLGDSDRSEGSATPLRNYLYGPGLPAGFPTPDSQVAQPVPSTSLVVKIYPKGNPVVEGVGPLPPNLLTIFDYRVVGIHPDETSLDDDGQPCIAWQVPLVYPEPSNAT